MKKLLLILLISIVLSQIEDKKECKSGEVLVNGKCRKKGGIGRCPSGHSYINGECKVIPGAGCRRPGEVRINGKCVCRGRGCRPPIPKQCKPGEKRIKGRCQKVSEEEQI